MYITYYLEGFNMFKCSFFMSLLLLNFLNNASDPRPEWLGPETKVSSSPYSRTITATYRGERNGIVCYAMKTKNRDTGITTDTVFILSPVKFAVPSLVAPSLTIIEKGEVDQKLLEAINNHVVG